MSDGTVSWFAGIDWGSEKHQVCLLDAAGKVVGEREFRHGGAGLAALCEWLVSVAGEPGRVAVAIEVPHGPVVDALLDRGFAVHAINPKQLERLRDRVSLAGAKDDRRDARVAAGGLRTDPHLFRPVAAGDPAVIALREWSRLAEELQQERVRLGNRIRQQLWRYYPQLLEVSDDVTAEWVLDLWTLAPTPAKAARLREATLARLLQRHRIRRVDAERALSILRQRAITVAEGVTEAAVLHLRSLVIRLRLANREFHQAERKLDELCATLRVCPGTSCGIAEPSQHEADRGKAEEGERLAVEVLPILGQPTAAVQPSYGAFDNPTLREHHKALGGIRALHDFKGHAPQDLLDRTSELRSLVSAIGVELQQKRIASEEHGHQPNTPVAILDMGGVHDRVHQQALRVDENVTLLAFDPFTRIIARRVDRGPPFSALFTLWLSMIATVGLASREACSRHFT
jgi:transposase